MRHIHWPWVMCLLVGAVVGLWACGSQAAAGPAGTGKPASALLAGQIRGFSIQLNNKDATAQYLAAIDELAGMGCTSINFVIAARQENVKSEAMAIDWNNLPNQTEIERILKHAKEKNIYTILMPIVLLNTAEAKQWRGVIAPPDWETWFYHYTKYITFSARMAKKCKVDLLCVGSELLSTEPMRSHWIEVIAEIKKIYKGKLTYSSNWDHYDKETTGGPAFWDQLDYIGMNNYNELAKKPGATTKELNNNWKPIKEKVLAFVAKQNKPFLFTEVGWHNLNNTIAEPWNYVATGEIDLGEQQRAYESFVETWGDVGTDKFMGALVWEWRPGANGATEHGAYSLQDTPALEIVKKWMAGK